MLRFNDPSHNNCLNCGRDLRGDFCDNCGQKRIRPYRSFPYLVKELLGSYFNFDSSLYRTLLKLVAFPGELTIRYAEGQRTKYIHPIRLYVFTSLVFFIFFGLMIGRQEGQANISFSGADGENIPVNELDSLAQSEADSTGSIFFFDDEYPMKDTPEEMQAYLDSLPAEEQPGRFTRALIMKAIVMQSDVKSGEDVNRELMGDFLNNLPKMMFLLLPLFALVVWLFYIRKHMYYEEHLIYSLHVHVFLFILILVFMLLQLISGAFWFLFPILVIGYLTVSQRRIFRQHTFLVFLKSIGLVFIYFMCIAALSVVNIIYAFLMY